MENESLCNLQLETEDISKLEAENRFLTHERQRLYKKVFKSHTPISSDYFDYIGTDWETPLKAPRLASEKSPESLETRLQKMLQDDYEERDLWKNGTELIARLKSESWQKESIFREAETREEQDPASFWEFRKEGGGAGMWPERYNKMFNYFLLSKDERNKAEMIVAREVRFF